MNIVTDKPITVFRRDTEFGSFYSVGLSKKNNEGSYINGYMSVQFKNGVELENKTKIYIKNAWLSFYLKEKETKPYIFISDFETLEDTINQAKQPKQQDPFVEMGQIVDDDLPF